jgi:hypothetical protein
MYFGYSIRGLVAVSALGLSLGACSKAPPAPEPSKVAAPAATPAAVKNIWTSLPADAAPGIAQAIRTVPLEGGGELVLILSCNYRSHSNAVMNGFWLKLEMGLRSQDANLGLDPLKTNEDNARFPVVRSTGEAGMMMLKITSFTDYVYQNNQTNELNQDNKDPAKVEMATSFDIPLNDGRTPTIPMQKDDAGYKDTLTRCAALPQT